MTSLVSFQFTDLAAAADALVAKGQPQQFVTIASATPIRYTPPPGLGTPKRTQGGGSRGCNQAVPVAFTLLVPTDHIGLTLAAHPTFAWYVSGDTTTPMKFSLAEPGVSRPLWTQDVTEQKTGINMLAMPEDTPALVPGKRYRWTLSQFCNSKRTAENSSTVRGWVQRAEVGAEPLMGSATKSSPLEQAQLLAQAGFWYDAVAALAQVHVARPTDQTATKYLITLLDQGGLKQVAEQERKRLNLNF